RRSLVARQNHAVGISWINPKGVVVVATRRSLVSDESLAPVLGPIERSLRDVDHIGVLRIQKHSAEIAAALNARVGCDALPGSSAIVGTVQPAISPIGRNNGKHSLAAECDSQPDSPKPFLRKI